MMITNEQQDDSCRRKTTKKTQSPEEAVTSKSKKEKVNASLGCSDTAEDAKNQTRSGKRTIRFCPKCGSTNIFWASGLPQLWSIWECRNCGYRGALIIEDGELAKKLEEEYAKRGKH